MEDWLEDTVLDALEQVAAGTNQTMVDVLVAVQGVIDNYDYGDSLDTNPAVADIGSYARGLNQLSANNLANLPAPTATGLTGHNANTPNINEVVSHGVPMPQVVAATLGSCYPQQLHGNEHPASGTGANNPAAASFNSQLIESQEAQVNGELAQVHQVQIGSAIAQASGGTAGGSAPSDSDTEVPQT
ncbi:hypothetical protein CSAL01_05937 [Colletotrichum salicis]|uniref:Uncharacterized protein n=1 Tax=Colletotrichum salicis TaxID=1209931 RepID=A0A135U0H4_9PEZI|nr:hypothetical protein CSAL01_05937 [Colletotrichum salicis]